jgi:ferric-dicitrate binding protein FerR (iron transport regulator)
MRRRPVLLIAVNAIILLTLFGWLMRSSLESERPAVAVATRGTVVVRRGGQGEWRPVALNEPIYSGDIVSCDTGGSLSLAAADGTRIYLQSNSTIHFKTSTINAITKQQHNEVRLISGVAKVQLARSPANPPNWFIETSTMRIHSQRGAFTLIADDMATQIALSEGSAEVENRASGISVGQALDTSMIPSPEDPVTRVLQAGETAAVNNTGRLEITPAKSELATTSAA